MTDTDERVCAHTAGEGLWVRSEVMPDGSYGVALTAGPDLSLTLDRDRAIAYAVACISRAIEAEHDAAVVCLLTDRLKLPVEVAAETVACELRPDRPDNHEPTAPLRFRTTVVKPGDPQPDDPPYIPVVMVELDGEELGRLTPAAVRRHATGVLDLAAVTDLDDRFFRFLIRRIGIDEGKARAVVAALSEYMPDNDIDNNGDGDDE